MDNRVFHFMLHTPQAALPAAGEPIEYDRTIPRTFGRYGLIPQVNVCVWQDAVLVDLEIGALVPDGPTAILRLVLPDHQWLTYLCRHRIDPADPRYDSSNTELIDAVIGKTIESFRKSPQILVPLLTDLVARVGHAAWAIGIRTGADSVRADVDNTKRVARAPLTSPEVQPHSHMPGVARGGSAAEWQRGMVADPGVDREAALPSGSAGCGMIDTIPDMLDMADH